MNGIALSYFFPHGLEDDQLRVKVKGLPTVANADCMLLGPNSAVKTCLLFQYALALGSLDAGGILYVCRRRYLEANPPLLGAGVAKSSPGFRNVHMKYVADAQELRKLLGHIHQLADFLSAIIIDDFSGLFPIHSGKIGDHRFSEVTKTLAFLHHAADFMTGRLLQAGKAAKCVVLISETTSVDGRHFHNIYKRWLPLVLRTAPLFKGEDGGEVEYRHSVSVTFAHRSSSEAAEQANPSSGSDISVEAIVSLGNSYQLEHLEWNRMEHSLL